MPVVELLYAPDCPNVPAAREQLRRGFEAIGAPPKWDEIDVAAEGAPARVVGYGSPTILVNGRDVTGASPDHGSSCRVYFGSDTRGVPPLGAIVASLQASPPARRVVGSPNLAVVPSVLLSIAPVVSCPSCWPTYAGVLGSLGVPFMMDASWLLPLTACALLFALAGLGYRARGRRGFAPLLLGSVSAAGILFGKVTLAPNAAYAGTALLVVASIWNSWPKKHPRACDACGGAGGTMVS